MVLQGTLRISTDDVRQTCGMFGDFMTANSDVFERYFDVVLFPGSLNVHVPQPETLQADLDARRPVPSITIPKHELRYSRLGDGQAWPCKLIGRQFSQACWIFRRIGSGVDPGVIEIVAEDRLVDKYQLLPGDKVEIHLDIPRDA